MPATQAKHIGLAKILVQIRENGHRMYSDLCNVLSALEVVSMLVESLLREIVESQE